jgi:hypothetical protein
MDIDRYAAPIVTDGHTAIRMDYHLDAVTSACQRSSIELSTTRRSGGVDIKSVPPTYMPETAYCRLTL